MTVSLPPDGLRVLEAQLGRMRAMTVGWTLLNGAYLAWYFIGRRDQRAIEAILAEAYEPTTSGEYD